MTQYGPAELSAHSESDVQAVPLSMPGPLVQMPLAQTPVLQPEEGEHWMQVPVAVSQSGDAGVAEQSAFVVHPAGLPASTGGGPASTGGVPASTNGKPASKAVPASLEVGPASGGPASTGAGTQVWDWLHVSSLPQLEFDVHWTHWPVLRRQTGVGEFLHSALLVQPVPASSVDPASGSVTGPESGSGDGPASTCTVGPESTSEEPASMGGEPESGLVNGPPSMSSIGPESGSPGGPASVSVIEPASGPVRPASPLLEGPASGEPWSLASGPSDEQVPVASHDAVGVWQTPPLQTSPAGQSVSERQSASFSHWWLRHCSPAGQSPMVVHRVPDLSAVQATSDTTAVSRKQ